MDTLEGRSEIGKTMCLADVIRRRVIDDFCKVRQRACNDAAQLPARDTCDFLVDGNVSADIERHRFIASIEKLELGIEKNEFRFITIEVHAPEQHDFAAGCELARLEIVAMEPFCVNEAAAIGENGVENRDAPPGLDHPAAINTRMHRRVLADLQRGESNEGGAVLIRLWNVKQQVFNSADTPRCQQRRTPRPYALHILDIRIESKHVPLPLTDVRFGSYAAGAGGRARNCKYALMNLSRSPLSTRSTSPTSTLVRRSFTMRYGCST